MQAQQGSGEKPTGAGGEGGPVNRARWARRQNWLPAAIWLLVLVSLPLARAAFGDEMLRHALTAGVLALTAAVVWLLAQAWGTWRALAAAAGCAGLAWLAEFAGVSSGVLFGSYTYTGQLQPQLLGVPLVIPLAWLMLLPPAWAVAAALLGARAKNRLAFAAVSAAAFSAWDLLLDPQMIAWGFWAWSQPGGYFGIPWANYLGWLLISGVLSALFGRADVPSQPLLLVYGLVWAVETLGLIFFWGLAGPGTVGGLVMGAFLAGALLKKAHIL